jgi:hypothetical protein
MYGEPLEFAKQAVAWGLSALTPHDEFCVIAYDHEQLVRETPSVP